MVFPGHTRYSTAGESELLNCQPFVVETQHGLIAVAHNGELVNANPLKQEVSNLYSTTLVNFLIIIIKLWLDVERHVKFNSLINQIKLLN